MIAFLEKEKNVTEWEDFGTCIPMVNQTTQFKCSGQLRQQRKCFNGTIEKCDKNDHTERNLTCVSSSCPIGKYIFIALVGFDYELFYVRKSYQQLLESFYHSHIAVWWHMFRKWQS